jgi:hypothetical protein
MTRKQAIKALFNQNRTEAMFGRKLVQESRALAKRREEAKARRRK